MGGRPRPWARRRRGRPNANRGAEVLEAENVRETSSSGAMEQGVFGLVGVVLGVLLTGFLGLIDRQGKQMAGMRRAIRLVGAEFAAGEQLATVHLDHLLGPRVPLKPFDPSVAWNEHKADLAALPIAETEWEKIHSAALAIAGLANYIEGTEAGLAAIIPDQVRTTLTKMRDTIAEGRRALSSLSRRGSRWRLR